MPGPSDDRRPTSWTARVLAPVVLVVVAAAIVLVISGSLSTTATTTRTERGARDDATTGCTPDAEQAVEDGYYVVQADDVEDLSGIADKTCIPVETLIELNPNLDPQALQVEQLRRPGRRRLQGARLRLSAALLRRRWPRSRRAERARRRRRRRATCPPRAWVLVDADDGEVLAAHRAASVAARSPRPRS